MKFFTTCFNNLGIKQVKHFAISQTADSTNLNPAIARKLGIPHVGCRAHAFSNASKKMGDNDVEFTEMMKTINESHKCIRQSNPLTAALENVQEQVYRLPLDSPTRFLQKAKVLTGHIKAEDDIKKVSSVALCYPMLTTLPLHRYLLAHKGAG